MRAHGTPRPGVANTQGFTLVEMMIVVVVIALLAAIGVPGYKVYSLKARRAAASAALEEAASRQEQFFLSDKTYTTTIGATGLNMADTTDGGHYQLRVEDPDPDCMLNQCYLLLAIPQNGQTADSCGTLTMSSSGDRLPDGCW